MTYRFPYSHFDSLKFNGPIEPLFTNGFYTYYPKDDVVFSDTTYIAQQLLLKYPDSVSLPYVFNDNDTNQILRTNEDHSITEVLYENKYTYTLRRITQDIVTIAYNEDYNGPLISTLFDITEEELRDFTDFIPIKSSLKPESTDTFFVRKSNEVLKTEDRGKSYSTFATLPDSVNEVLVHYNAVYYIRKKEVFVIKNGKHTSIYSLSTTSMDDLPSIPKTTSFSLELIYPNPFNTITTIDFSIGKTLQVEITIFDSMGRAVKNWGKKTYNVGNYSLKWNASSLSSGVYWLYAQYEGKTITKKMILIK